MVHFVGPLWTLDYFAPCNLKPGWTHSALLSVVHYDPWSHLRLPFEFGKISKICRQAEQAEQAGKLGRPKIRCIVFLHPNREICNLQHILNNKIHDNVEM